MLSRIGQRGGMPEADCSEISCGHGLACGIYSGLETRFHKIICELPIEILAKCETTSAQVRR